MLIEYKYCPNIAHKPLVIIHIYTDDNLLALFVLVDPKSGVLTLKLIAGLLKLVDVFLFGGFDSKT